MNEDLKEIIKDILEKSKVTDPASEDLCQSLNKIIAQRQLPGKEVLIILARVSAGYIKLMKKHLNDPQEKDAVEDYFDNALQAYIACGDIHDAYRKIIELQNEKLN